MPGAYLVRDSRAGQKKCFFPVLFCLLLFGNLLKYLHVCLSLRGQQAKRKPPVGAGYSGEPHESGKPPKSNINDQ